MRWPPSWMQAPETCALVAALDDAGIEARFVGGAVRDSVLGRPGREIDDIDIATPARPEAVMAALSGAGIKAVPTGLAHGTVTAVFAQARVKRRFEITTLRRDVETDGRHAIVAFDADWAGDAARRDFTINAIYLGSDGTIYDPVGGRADLDARRVRFVGDPARRLAEDVLRLLRYYRFEARFGGGDGDAAARAACRGTVALLPTLSPERVWRELSGLLTTPAPIRALAMMRADGVLAAVLPEADRINRIERLVALKAGESIPPDALLRLAALVSIDAAGAAGIAERLRLSRSERDRLIALAQPWPLDPAGDLRTQRLALHRLGPERYRDLALLLAADGGMTETRLRELLALASGWTPPVFPVGGRDAAALGIPEGPAVGRLLAAVRCWWEDGDFSADRARCLARLRELAAPR